MILRIILGLLLLLIPASVLYLWDKKLLRGLGLGVVRMVGQTLVLCLMVWALLRYDHVWVSLLWLVLLCVYTSGVIITRVKGRLSRLLLPVSIAQIVGTLLPTCYLLTVMLPGTEGFTTRWLVPAGALLMSHITASQIRGLSTYLSAIETDREQYEFLLGNGKEHLGAVIPFVRRAVQAILSPSAAQLAVTGLFTMPLLLAGMLLAGVAPLNAFIAMLLFTCGCLAGSVIALILSLWLCDRYLFVKIAPLPLQESWDNAGLQVGLTETEVSGALLCLDVNEKIVDEAVSKGCNVIVSHHPLLFRGLKTISDLTDVQRTVRKAVQQDICVISMHTNMDNAKGGVNFRIAQKLGLTDVRFLVPTGSATIERTFGVECAMCNELLRRPIRRVALCGGAGDFLLDEAVKAGADAFITGEMHYHQYFGYEQQLQICVIGHYQSEQFTAEIFEEIIRQACPGVKTLMAETCTNPIYYL